MVPISIADKAILVTRIPMTKIQIITSLLGITEFPRLFQSSFVVKLVVESSPHPVPYKTSSYDTTCGAKDSSYDSTENSTRNRADSKKQPPPAAPPMAPATPPCPAPIAAWTRSLLGKVAPEFISRRIYFWFLLLEALVLFRNGRLFLVFSVLNQLQYIHCAGYGLLELEHR
jgi:hypothetical protein